jgi:GGDEF domain-containing protein
LREAGASTFQAIWDQIEGHVLCNPIEVGGERLPVSVSAGMSVFGMDTGEIYELIDFADYAMYCAKKNCKHGYQVFSKVNYVKAKSISNQT